jgi:hypothetical protein
LYFVFSWISTLPDYYYQCDAFLKRIAAQGDSRSPYLMQQLAPGSLSEQYFVGLGAMLSAYEMAHWRTGVRSFDAVGQTDFQWVTVG